MFPPVEPNRPDHYYDLGLDQCATIAQIKKAYHAKAFRHYPDRPHQPVDAAKFQKAKEAYDMLMNPLKRAKYDAIYGTILQQWLAYDASYKIWSAETERQRELASEQRRKREAEKARQAEEHVKAEEQARQIQEELRQAEQRAQAERLKKEKEEHAAGEQLRKATEEAQARQARAAIKKKWRDAEERQKKVLEKAQKEQARIAQERLRKQEEGEAAHKAAQQERKAEAVQSTAEEPRPQGEQNEEGQRAAEEDQPRQEKRKEAERAAQEESRRRQEAKGGEFQHNTGFKDEMERRRRESEAAQRFIHKIMQIREETKVEVLKDVTLITLEAVDSELRAQRDGHYKRKLAPESDDPSRLVALVDDIFGKLEAGGEEREKFRFTKKQKKF